MHNISPTDPGRTINWGNTSQDYAQHRPGPPDSFYKKLAAHEVGLPRQTLLDLGTGTGLLAREFATRGCEVSATDISAEQVAIAQSLAQQQNLDIDFRTAGAEQQPFADHGFDIITANQCWFYFDLDKVIPEVQRLLKASGKLVVSHFSWLPRSDAIAYDMEQLVLKHNPAWTAADWSGEIPAQPQWSHSDFDLCAMFYYDEAIPFTREGWRGRIRASRGVGAALSAQEVEAFDSEHDALLKQKYTDEFTVLHRIDAHIYTLKD